MNFKPQINGLKAKLTLNFKKKVMNQREQVIEVMKENGGYATLGYLNKNVDVGNWATKTPFASIRRIVQNEKYFFKIKPGLWALKSYKEIIFKRFEIQSGNKENDNRFTHTYYQGLITEIGNMRGYRTYVPNQDKNKMYLDKPLCSITSLQNIYNFSYNEIIDRAKTVDTIWFNERKLPNAFFEIENSTNFQNSLSKFYDLQDYNAKFYVIAPISRRREYENILNRNLFKQIRNIIRLEFMNYDDISELHSKTSELFKLQKRIRL